MSDRSLKEELGSPVVAGEHRYFSVTGLEKGDPRSGGCWQKYYRRRVLHEKEPISEKSQTQMEKGDGVHTSIEHYYKTGEKALPPIVLKAMHLLPPRGPGLLLEQALHSINPLTREISSVLTAAGKPFVGYMDLINLRGDTVDEYGDRDPPGTIEVNDWKLKGNAKDRHGNSLLKHPDELIRTIQMGGYGEAIRRAFPGTQHVRISHTNFIEKGGESKKVTRLHVVQEFEEGWKYVEGIARTAIEIVREPDLKRVPYNSNACSAYGGCPYRDVCPGFQRTSLDSLWNKVASDFKENDMGLLTNLPPQQPIDVQAQPVTHQPVIYPQQPMQSPPQPTYAPVPQPQYTTPAQPDMRAQLAQEEANLRAQQAAMRPAPAQPNLIAAWQRIQQFNRGTPDLQGAAAQAFAAACGQTSCPPTGSGQLAAITLKEPSHIFQLLAELEGSNAPVPAPVNVPPPPAPVQSMGILAPDAPSSVPALAAQLPQAPAPIVIPAAAAGPAQMNESGPVEAPKKRGRPKKSETVGGATQTAASVVPPPHAPGVTQVANPPTVSTFSQTASSDGDSGRALLDESDGTTAIYIDCRPLGEDTSPLDGLIDWLNRDLASKYCVDATGKPTVQDIRCAPKDSVLAYGGWKGALHEIVRRNGTPGAGRWHLDTRGDEMKQIAADALRVWAAENNVEFVQGVR